MKYRPLPFIKTLEEISDSDPARAVKLRSTAMSEFSKSEGAQILTHILREIESRALMGIRLGVSPDKANKMLGQIEAIESIRQSLALCLPESERETVDWFDDQEEEFVGSASPSKE